MDSSVKETKSKTSALSMPKGLTGSLVFTVGLILALCMVAGAVAWVIIEAPSLAHRFKTEPATATQWLTITIVLQLLSSIVYLAYLRIAPDDKHRKAPLGETLSGAGWGLLSVLAITWMVLDVKYDASAYVYPTLGLALKIVSGLVIFIVLVASIAKTPCFEAL